MKFVARRARHPTVLASGERLHGMCAVRGAVRCPFHAMRMVRQMGGAHADVESMPQPLRCTAGAQGARAQIRTQHPHPSALTTSALVRVDCSPMSFTTATLAHAAAPQGLGMVRSALSRKALALGARMITTMTTAAT